MLQSGREAAVSACEQPVDVEGREGGELLGQPLAVGEHVQVREQSLGRAQGSSHGWPWSGLESRSRLGSVVHVCLCTGCGIGAG